MKSFKKLFALVLSVALISTAITAGTIAYLQDEDSDVNVMTLGNVKIEQIEQERNENGELVDFTQAKPLYPYVGELDWENKDEANGAYRSFTVNNAVDKYVTVKNTGKSDAYVRTIIALEMGSFTEEEFNMIGLSINSENGSEFKFDGTWNWLDGFTAEIDGYNYYIMTAVHRNPVKPGETTIPSLLQVYLSKDATNEDVEKLDGNKNGTFDILVLSQAVQTAGFENAKTALDTGFGELNETNVKTWFGDVEFPDFDKTREDDSVIYNGITFNSLQDALAAANEIGDGEIILKGNTTVSETLIIPANITISGDGYKIGRTNGFTGTMFKVADAKTLTLENLKLDGGAVWTGEINETLKRGTVNTGITATGAIVETGSNAHLVLAKGAVLQNNSGANAVNLGTRIGSTLTLNGGEIINNYSSAGAIWGGGTITINSGKINYNHGGVGGAIRAVTNIGTILTMNGGEMNHNYSDGNGGAIWAGTSKSNNVYVLNGGEMAHNYSALTGGAIYAGYYETVKIGGTFKMYDNDCAEALGAAIRFHNHASFEMTGGEIYDNGNGQNSLYLNNNSASITGGKIKDNFGYSGGLQLTWGNAEVDGVITYNLSTNHNTALLAKEFGTVRFIVNESSSNFSQFNFKPAADYVYTVGDEAKLVCLNEGYETYWTGSVFKLQAK